MTESEIGMQCVIETHSRLIDQVVTEKITHEMAAQLSCNHAEALLKLLRERRENKKKNG